MSIALHHAGNGVPRGTTERRTLGGTVRRVAISTFFASVAVNAALGIYAVLSPDFGDTQGRILGTSLCVTGALLITLACEPAWERRLLGPVPFLGAGLGAVGFALLIATMWIDPQGDPSWTKLVGTILVVAAGCMLASLLALARLSPRHAWIRKATFALLALGTAMYAALPWLEDPGEWFTRPFGVVMIALAAFVVSVPVVHWIDRGAVAAAEVTDTVRYCPYCGRGIAGETGAELACERCGREFSVTGAGHHFTESEST